MGLDIFKFGMEKIETKGPTTYILVGGSMPAQLLPCPKCSIA
jgi:hypothetical protein